MNTKFFTAVLLLVSITNAAFSQEQTLDWYRSFFKADYKFQVQDGIARARRKINNADDDARLKALGYKELALIKIANHLEYDSAIDHLINAVAIEESVGLTSERIFSYLAKAEVVRQVLDYKSADRALEEAFRLNQQQGDDPDLKVYILNKHGEIAALEGSLSDASDYFSNALRFESELSIPGIAAEVISNNAKLMQLRGDYNEALDEFRKALRVERRLGLKEEEAQTLHDIGQLYVAIKNFERGMANHMEALKIRLTFKASRLRAQSYNSIAEVYKIQQMYDSTIANSKRGLSAARESNESAEVRRSCELLAESYKAIGNVAEALRYREEFGNIVDFINNDRNEQLVIAHDRRDVINRKENQIGKLEDKNSSLTQLNAETERQLQEEANFRYVLIGFIGLGTVIGLLILYLYISKRKANRALKAINEKVQLQNIQLQELNATKDKFFSIISHDLKGPLNSLTSFSGLLIDHTDSLSKDEIQMLAKDLDKSVKNLFALLENLLEWSRSQTGNIDFKADEFDLGELLRINQQLLEVQAASKKISIVNVNDNPVRVRVHKHSVNTVIRNLISNAIKFTKPGGRITLSVVDDDNFFRVSVADTGVGMTPELMEKLFRIDSKVTTKGTSDEKGTGLGLILCKEFIEKNGGRIWVESEVNKGTVFHFTVPKQHQKVLEPA